MKAKLTSLPARLKEYVVGHDNTLRSKMPSQADRNYSTRPQSPQANCDSGNTTERLSCFELGLRRRHVEICVPLELSEDAGPIQLVQFGRLQATRINGKRIRKDKSYSH